MLYAARDGPKELENIKLIDVLRGGPSNADELFWAYSVISKHNIWNALDDGKQHELKKFYNSHTLYDVKN